MRWNWVSEDERLDDILEYNKPEYHPDYKEEIEEEEEEGGTE